MKNESDGTHLPHFLAQACENDVTEGICRHLMDMLLGVPLLALEAVRLDGYLQVLFVGVAARTHYLPVKVPRFSWESGDQRRARTFISPKKWQGTPPGCQVDHVHSGYEASLSTQAGSIGKEPSKDIR